MKVLVAIATYGTNNCAYLLQTDRRLLEDAVSDGHGFCVEYSKDLAANVEVVVGAFRKPMVIATKASGGPGEREQ
jgi:hypothetical protein